MVAGKHDAVTEVIVDEGFTVTTLVPHFDGSWVEVAFTVTDNVPEVIGAV